MLIPWRYASHNHSLFSLCSYSSSSSNSDKLGTCGRRYWYWSCITISLTWCEVCVNLIIAFSSLLYILWKYNDQWCWYEKILAALFLLSCWFYCWRYVNITILPRHCVWATRLFHGHCCEWFKEHLSSLSLLVSFRGKFASLSSFLFKCLICFRKQWLQFSHKQGGLTY